MPVFQLYDAPVFPHPDLAEEDGLLALGGDLSVPRLLQAYAWTVFPWYSEETPLLWWSPDPRLVLFCDEFHMPRSLRRTLNKGEFRLSVDQSFEQIIQGCARAKRPEGEGTWLTPEMIDAYSELHRQGHAHCVATWQGEELVGGIYGVALGRIFYGESMFYSVPNASKAALVALVQVLRERGFTAMDCQQTTAHMLRFGAREIPRGQLLHLVQKGLEETRVQDSPWGGEGLLRWVPSRRQFRPEEGWRER